MASESSHLVPKTAHQVCLTMELDGPPTACKRGFRWFFSQGPAARPSLLNKAMAHSYYRASFDHEVPEGFGQVVNIDVTITAHSAASCIASAACVLLRLSGASIIERDMTS